MKFTFNKQSGVFLLREDILDTISMQAKSNASTNAAITDDARKAQKKYNEAKQPSHCGFGW